MASGKGGVWINDFLKLILNGTAIANIADNAASSPLTNLYGSLHTATLTKNSAQNSSEAAYGSYARVAIARSTGGFTAASAQSSTLVAAMTFPTATSGSETETHAMLGTASSGAGKNLWWGSINSPVGVTSGVTPELTNTSSITET